MSKKLQVTQYKSSCNEVKKIKDTLKGLSLGKINRKATLEDTPAVRGMINKVSHLVKII